MDMALNIKKKHK